KGQRVKGEGHPLPFTLYPLTFTLYTLPQPEVEHAFLSSRLQASERGARRPRCALRRSPIPGGFPGVLEPASGARRQLRSVGHTRRAPKFDASGVSAKILLGKLEVVTLLRGEP